MVKIDIKDLRIDNLVYSSFTKTPCKVTGIILDESGYGVCKVTGVNGYKDVESLSPIPLTKEILEKNFKYSVCNEYDYYELGEEFCLRVIDSEFFLCYWEDIEYSIYQCPKCIYSIDSVHQLQNLLRELGIEKEITI